MEKVRLGRTGLMVTRTAFGALPIQRVGFDEATHILRKAYDGGVNFFDTARGYSDSEEKIGRALSDVRTEVIIATKSHARDGAGLLAHLETSLTNLKTDYVDILQLHNPAEIPDPNDPDSTYSAAIEAQRRGMVRFIGISNHSIAVATEAVRSGLFDTLQFPLSALSSPGDLALVDECTSHDVGLIAMKALAGGLITNATTAFAFLRQFEKIVPIWGIQAESELDEFLALAENPPLLNDELRAVIEKDIAELSGDFCRGCGYCLPCPVEIPINMAARMSLLLRRAPSENFLTEDWQEKMSRIENCIECNQCKDRCPYDLNTPELLKKNLKDYRTFLK
ncbi:MAG: aldo/keto reductase [Planctomycetes bacterium]|nr:aldo/keto reductase [Planctomycetota bacterium]